MKVDLVLEGGGILGISYIGALKAFEERKFKIERCAGTSAGALIAALIMAGYNSRELSDLLRNIDFKRLAKKTNIGKMYIVGKPLSIIFDKGLYDSEIVESFIGDLLKKKGIVKFKDIMLNGKSKLKIIASDITRRKMLILPDDLKQYGVDPMEFSIAKAVRMSCAIPLFFTPIKLMYNNEQCYIVDGGLLSNFPIWIFDGENTSQIVTFGLKTKDPDSFSAQGRTNIINYVKDIINAPLKVDQDNFVRSKDRVRTIVIDYGGKIKSTDFNKSEKLLMSLYDHGYECTERFMNNWDYHRYLQMYTSSVG